MNISNNTVLEKYSYGRYEFLSEAPGLAFTSIILLLITSTFGTIGNILVVMIYATTKSLRQVQSIFIVNLAISDMYITMIAGPMSIVGKLEGRMFFDRYPALCNVVGKLCTISCIVSLGSISFLSFNRYVFICHKTVYKKIFSSLISITMCASLYCIGLVFVLLNIAGIGGHGFDDKSLECIWDRMASYTFTVIFSVCLVWIPVIVVGLSYLSLLYRVKKIQQRVADIKTTQNKTSLKLAKTIFIVYSVFSLCWIPFAILLVADVNDTFSHKTHLIITVFAHFHPSFNWLIYYFTNSKFKVALNKIFERCNNICRGSNNSSHGIEVIELS